MNIKLISDISKDDYEKFSLCSKYTHFCQSYNFGQISKFKGLTPHYVGLYIDNELRACTLLLKKNLIKGYGYFYAPRGYIIDFNDINLVNTFSLELKKYAKKNKAFFIKIDPAIKRHTINQNGEIVDGENNEELINKLINIGYKHLGFNLGFEHEQPRFTFRLDLNQNFNDLYANIHSTTRQILNKGNQYNLDIIKGSNDDVDDFLITMKKTAEREGLHQFNDNYYRAFFDTFNKDKQSDLYLVKANTPRIKEALITNINEMKNNIIRIEQAKNTNPRKSKALINNLTESITKKEKLLSSLDSIKEEELTLSSIITVKYGDKVWTVHGGNHTLLSNLNANYLCYFQIIKDAYAEGYKCVDCFGASGNPNPDKTDHIYGLHNFKKRLGGEYTEFIGEFDYIVSPLLYYSYQTLIPIFRKLRNLIKGQ